MSDEFNVPESGDEQPAASSGRLPGLRRIFSRFLRRGNGAKAANPDASTSQRRGLARFLPRFLRRREPGREDVSAADLALEAEERPIEELDERLRALRERASARAQPEPAAARQALHDVDELLVSPELVHQPGGVISPLALSKAQQEQVALLREMLGADAEPDESQPPGRLKRSLGAFSISALPQLLIAILILLALALPFASSDFSDWELPPGAFGSDRAGAARAFDLLDELRSQDHVLLAMEYAPTAAGELDGMTDLILRHILARGAKPVIVSGNPIALARARNLLDAIKRSVAGDAITLEENRDYYLLRYLPGGHLGLRDLSRNPGSVMRFSSRGNATGLAISDLDALRLIVLIAERAHDIRSWAEQVATETDTTFIVASAYAAWPLAQPYADQSPEIVGLLVGFRDTYTYGQQLAAKYDGSGPPARVTATPSATATATVMPATALTATATATDTSTPTPTASPTLADRISETPASRIPVTDVLNETAAAKLTLVGTDARDPDPDSQAAAPAAASPQRVAVAEVIADYQARIRRSPNTASDILRLTQAGDIFRAIGANGDGSWVKILLPDAVEGWIAAFLVEQYEMTMERFRAWQAGDSASAGKPRSVLRLSFSLQLGKDRPLLYQADAPGAAPKPEIVQARDRSQEGAKLDAMSLGTLAAVLIIAVGNLFYLLRGVARRGRGTNG